MFGVTSFTAIINPPQAAILSVGSVGASDRSCARMMRSFPSDDHRHARRDHRILYGADAARFLARIRELLEQPASLTL